MQTLRWLAAGATVYALAALYARRSAGRAERRFPPAGEFLSVEGVPLHYVRQGEGMPVVLLHGSDGFLQDYTLTILDDVAREFDAIALDRPGHGYSGLPDGERATAPVQARMLHEALAQLGVQRPLLVGHSWSGLLLLVYAWRYPDDVAGMVLLYPWVSPGRVAEPRLRVLAEPWVSRALHPLFAPMKPLIVRAFVAAAFKPDSAPPEYAAQAEALWLRTPRQLAATARENSGNRRALAGFAPSRVPAHIPVTILIGDCDRVTPAGRQALRLASELPNARLIVVPGRGHELPHTASDVVMESVRACILALTKAGRCAGAPLPPGR